MFCSSPPLMNFLPHSPMCVYITVFWHKLWNYVAEKGWKAPGQSPSCSGLSLSKPSSTISESFRFFTAPLASLDALPLVMAAAAGNGATVERKLL